MGELIPLTLSKSERLNNIKLIDSVFKSAITVKAFPLIFSYKLTDFPSEVPLQILITVSKRNFKRAVDRNRIKRVIRDRFRLLKPEFVQSLKGKSAFAALIYTSKSMVDYREIDKSLQKLIQKLDETNR